MLLHAARWGVLYLLIGGWGALGGGVVQAQDGRSLDLTIRNVGLSIGNTPCLTGLRINVRDRGMERVNGVNLTLWRPHEVDEDGPTGTVNGLALGVPLTGAATINGTAIGLLGIEGHAAVRGIAIGGLGVGTGGRFTGLGVGGLGVGSGDDLRGLAIGGLGAGSGDDGYGIMTGGLGVGVGDRLTGLAVGGLGVGAGRTLNGIAVGGLGVGAGEHIRGLAVALIGVGAGETLIGFAASGVGLGVGERLQGVFATGVGLGAPTIDGITAGAVIGSTQYTGLGVAPAYFRIADGGQLRGVAVSAFNHVRGAQHGLTIGLFNYTRVLQGVQLGVLNYAGNNPRWLRLLPGFNVHL